MIADCIKRCSSFILIPHIGIDGDDLGSMLALYWALTSIGKEVVFFSNEPVPEQLAFLKGAELVSRNIPNTAFDCAILMECVSIQRIPDFVKPDELASTVINLDHHKGNVMPAHFHYVDESASALGEIVYFLLLELGIEINTDIASSIYLAIISDTGCFRYSNTTAKTHYVASKMLSLGIDAYRIAKHLFLENPINLVRLTGKLMSSINSEADGKILWSFITLGLLEEYGLSIDELQKVVEELNVVKGCHIFALFTETPQRTLRVSLRSSENFSVRKIALQYGGGGHDSAAGCTLSSSDTASISSFVADLVSALN